MYDYSVYKSTKGTSFVNKLATRSTSFVVDPGIRSASTSYYYHRTSSAPPLLYTTVSSTVPQTASSSGTYTIQLFQGATRSMVNSLTVTPTDTTVSNDLVVPNDIYIGRGKEWRIHIDSERQSFVFQRLTAPGTYNTEFEICHSG